MKKTLIIIGCCFIISIVTITTLFLLSDNLKRQPNSFLRIIPPHPALQNKMFDLKYNSYYIAGMTDHTIYLGNYVAPLHLLVLNSSLTDSQSVKIKMRNFEKQGFWTVRVKVDSPNFFMMDGTLPKIFSGNVSDWQAGRHVYDSAFFVDAIPLSKSTFAIRSLSSASNQYELGKESSDTPHINLRPELLEKQIDGQFCVDGMMSYDKKTSRLVYTYFYRNEYLVMDSSLTLKFRGRTIDTISRAQIKVASIASNNSRTMAAPPLMVNRKSCVSGKWLFVNSDLMARNESHEQFKDLSVIDVYDLDSKEYKFSFYLSHYTRSKVRDFRVFNKKLIALFDHFIVTFDLTSKFFPD